MSVMGESFQRNGVLMSITDGTFAPEFRAQRKSMPLLSNAWLN
jgi:hypothetical protein